MALGRRACTRAMASARGMPASIRMRAATPRLRPIWSAATPRACPSCLRPVLSCTVPVDLFTVLAHGVVQVPTLEGHLIKLALADGAEQTLPGMGFPNKDGSRGPLHVVLQTLTPTTYSAAQQALLAQSGDVARTQNEQIDSFRVQLAAMQQQVAQTLQTTTQALTQQAQAGSHAAHLREQTIREQLCLAHLVKRRPYGLCNKCLFGSQHEKTAGLFAFGYVCRLYLTWSQKTKSPLLNPS